MRKEKATYMGLAQNAEGLHVSPTVWVQLRRCNVQRAQHTHDEIVQWLPHM